LKAPRGLDADAAGNLFIADCADARVRKLTPAGVISTVAGGGDQLNTGVATNVALGCPSDIAVVQSGPDAGAFYIADSGDNRIRKVSPTGMISTVVGTGVAGFAGDGGAATAAKLNKPEGVTIAPNGDLLIADTGNNRVRRVDVTTGRISTVAGNGTVVFGKDNVGATATSVVGPTDVVVDPTGNLVIAEAVFNRLRRVNTTTGKITTIAGDGVPGFSGDGGPAIAATLFAPTQIAFDAAGNLLFTDRDNSRIRQIASGNPAGPPAMGCGSVVTANTTLTADVGPCLHDGLDIGADNITLNLNGHKIVGTGTGDGDHAGIRLVSRRGVTITGPTGSTVQGFADGIAIIGSSATKVSNLTVTNNVGPATANSVFGDGIGIFFSDHTTIFHNTITNNGIYDGVGILGPRSDDNLVKDNVISGTDDRGQITGGTGNGIIVNPFLSVDFPREVSVFRNRLIGNTVTNNDNSGMANLSNVYGVVANNIVTGNGRDPNNAPRNGIGIQHLERAQPDTHTLVEYNVVTNNAGDGILVGSDKNTVQSNQVHGNGTGI
ncbi:MAG: right-handed parallel beta-helix repeat-containing protein, partial [Actinobacteria bacterium]|nr:right-handed parallel beta-helix repeat-containing protein [Actinomycetota bacterium]